MDAEEVEVECGGENQRVNPFLAHTALPEFDQLTHRPGRPAGRNGFEADATAAIGVFLDDVHVLFLVNARIPDVAARKFVESFEGGFGEGELWSAVVDEPEGVPVAANFLLIAVAQGRFAKEQGADAGLIHLDPFDAIGRNRAFDEGMFAERFELLR